MKLSRLFTLWTLMFSCSILAGNEIHFERNFTTGCLRNTETYLPFIRKETKVFKSSKLTHTIQAYQDLECTVPLGKPTILRYTTEFMNPQTITFWDGRKVQGYDYKEDSYNHRGDKIVRYLSVGIQSYQERRALIFTKKGFRSEWHGNIKWNRKPIGALWVEVVIPVPI